MRIFDPKDQLGNSLLSSADTALSSKRLEKEMVEGVEAITLSSADISDIENWELCNASVMVGGKAVSFLPETSKDEYGNITVVFGQSFENVILVLKRVEFGAMCEQEQLTIEVRIRRLMGETMATAMSPTPRTETEVQGNVQRWKDLGDEAKRIEPTNYPYANCSNETQLTAAGLNPSIATTIGKNVCLISFDTVNNDYSGARTFPNVENFGADLPSLKNGSYMFYSQTCLKTFTGKVPNITEGTFMFSDCTGLTEWKVELPNSLTTAEGMFEGCSKLTEWKVELPNSLTFARRMFRGCTGLTEWNVALPDSIMVAVSMFQDCEGLKSWTAALPNNLQHAGAMFRGCVGLTEWTVALPDSLVSTSQMFRECAGLNKWTVALPDSIIEANGMFQTCINLRKFTPSLAGLINCTGFKQMFSGCKLNEDSIRNVLTTLPDQTDKTKLYIYDVGCDGTIDLDTRKELGDLAQQISGERNYYITLSWN